MKFNFKNLLVVITFMIASNVVIAQNEYLANTPASLGDGDNPYVGTSYTYTVAPGAGTIQWTVYSADDLDPGNVVDPAAASPAYTISGGTTASATIVWNTPGTYYLTYSEDLNGCVTRRGVIVEVAANNFQIAMEANKTAVCNVKEGAVLNWNNYNEAGEEVKTTVTYEINMSKEDDFAIQSWQFNGAFTLPTGLTIADAADVTSNVGSISVSGSANENFALTGMNGTQKSVIITVKVSGLVTASGTIPLAISGGQALSGPTSAIITGNSETANQSQTNELKPLPGASNISF